MRRALAGGICAALLASAALAQSPTTFSGVSSNPTAPPLSASGLNAAFATKQDFGGVVSTSTVIPSGGSVAANLANLFAQIHVVPDWFYQVGDGTDDAPSIRRAQATGKPVDFLCRHYNIRSPSTITNRAAWKGCGWLQTNFGAAGVLPGTWFDIDASFQSAPVAGANAGLFPFKFDGGVYSTGSVVEGIAVSQPQPLPVPGAPTWTPNTYTWVFVANNLLGGMTFRNILFYGVDNGIYSTGTGRLEAHSIYGHLFHTMLYIDGAYDVDRIEDLHQWPYWCDCTQVEQYTQANSDTIVMGRVDTPMVSRIFSIFVRSVFRFANIGNGVMTGGNFSAIQCDSVQWCLYVDSSAFGLTLQSDMIRSFGQYQNRAPQYATGYITGNTLTVSSIGDSYFSVGTVISGAGITGTPAITALGTGTGGLGTYTVNGSAQTTSLNSIVGTNPTVMIANSSVIRIDGSTTEMQIGSLVDFGSDLATLTLNSGTTASHLDIGSIFAANVQFARVNASLMYAGSPSPVHSVNLGAPPLFSGTKPTGYRFLQSGSTAALQSPTMSVLSP